MVTHPRRNADAKAWLRGLLDANEMVLVPEIADYEVRRELLRVGSLHGLDRLDLLGATLGYAPVTGQVLRRAAELWAESRRQGKPTASAAALDADVIIAAQAQRLETDNDAVVVATTNVVHLARFVDAREWLNIR